MKVGFLTRIGAVLRAPDLGPIGIALFLHGLSQGMTVPLIAIWIVHGYGRGAGSVAAYFTAVAAGGLILNPLLGRASDRWGRRRPTAVIAAALQSAGLATLALRPPFAAVLVAAALLLAAQVQPQLFSLVNDHVGAGTAQLPRAFTVATVRGAISAAWVVGAPVGGLLGAHALGLTFALAAAVNASAAAVVVWLCHEGGASARHARGHGSAGPAAPRRPRWLHLGLFGTGAMLAVAGNAAKMQAVPLYLAHLGLRVPAVGLVYGWMALTELLLLPPWGALADRMQRRHAVALGTVGGAVFFVLIALAPGPLPVLLAFPAMALFVAGLYGVGIGYAQDLDPGNAGLAGGVFFAAQGVGQVLGGPLIAASLARVGAPHAFLAPAGAILAGAGAVLLTRPAAAPPAPAALPATAAAAAAPVP